MGKGILHHMGPLIIFLLVYSFAGPPALPAVVQKRVGQRRQRQQPASHAARNRWEPSGLLALLQNVTPDDTWRLLRLIPQLIVQFNALDVTVNTVSRLCQMIWIIDHN